MQKPAKGFRIRIWLHSFGGRVHVFFVWSWDAAIESHISQWPWAVIDHVGITHSSWRQELQLKKKERKPWLLFISLLSRSPTPVTLLPELKLTPDLLNCNQSFLCFSFRPGFINVVNSDTRGDLLELSSYSRSRCCICGNTDGFPATRNLEFQTSDVEQCHDHTANGQIFGVPLLTRRSGEHVQVGTQLLWVKELERNKPQKGNCTSFCPYLYVRGPICSCTWKQCTSGFWICFTWYFILIWSVCWCIHFYSGMYF